MASQHRQREGWSTRKREDRRGEREREREKERGTAWRTPTSDLQTQQLDHKPCTTRCDALTLRISLTSSSLGEVTGPPAAVAGTTGLQAFMRLMFGFKN